MLVTVTDDIVSTSKLRFRKTAKTCGGLGMDDPIASGNKGVIHGLTTYWLHYVPGANDTAHAESELAHVCACIST